MDRVREMIKDMLSGRPDRSARLADIQHFSPLSAPATLYKLMKMTEDGDVTVVRTLQRETIYTLSPYGDNEKEMGDVDASPEEKHTGENHVRSTP